MVEWRYIHGSSGTYGAKAMRFPSLSNYRPMYQADGAVGRLSSIQTHKHLYALGSP